MTKTKIKQNPIKYKVRFKGEIKNYKFFIKLLRKKSIIIITTMIKSKTHNKKS